MTTRRRRREDVSRPDFGVPTPEETPDTTARPAPAAAPPPPTASPPPPRAAAPEDILDFEEAVTVDADDLPLLASALPAPLSINRGALTDESHAASRPRPKTAPPAPASPKRNHDEQSESLPAPAVNMPAGTPAAATEVTQAADTNGAPDGDFDSFLESLTTGGEDADAPVEEALTDDLDIAEFADTDEDDDHDHPTPAAPTAPVEPSLVALEDDEDEDSPNGDPEPLNPDGLLNNDGFWATLEAAADEEDAIPPALLKDGVDGSVPAGAASMSIFRKRPEPRRLSDDELEELKSERPDTGPVTAAGGTEEPEEYTPLVVDEEIHAAGKDWHPAVHVAARRAMFAGPSALSLVSGVKDKENMDELNHALSAFSELESGQRGFIRISLRTYPGFKQESQQWLGAQHTGQNPDEKGLHKRAAAWVRYLFAILWFEVNKANPSRLGGHTPPLAPGDRGDVKKLRAGDVSDETRQAWKDAERKVLATPHYETQVRIGVVGKNDAAQDLERLADEVALGFAGVSTPHQELVWSKVDEYDACIGFMGTKRDPGALALSADELGHLAHVPDDTTRPQSVTIKRSNFKQLPLPNPIIIPDPYNPPPGMIPLGIINPRSEDAKVFGMRVAELDKHMFYVGATGTGKSELMKWLVFGVVKADYPLVVIDPHGALSDDLLNMLVVNCPERLKDVVVCDLSDPDWPVALNPLDVRSFEGIEPTVHSIMEMLAKQMSLGQSAPRAVNLASQALSALCEANLHIKDPDTKCTLLSVVTFFIDVEFRRLVMEFCSNMSVRETFDPEKGPYEMLSEKQQTEFAMPIIRAFQPLGSSDSFSAVFSAGENRLDFGTLISHKSIVLVKLARFSHQKKLGEFVGALILPWLLSSMDSWGRKRDPETGETHGRGCRIFVDEAPTLIGPGSSAIELLAESRKWDLGMVTTCQYPSQFDRSVVDSLYANTNSKISLRLDPSEAGGLAKSIAGTSGKVTAGDVADLPNFHYYANILLPTDAGSSGSGAFSAACLPPINCKLGAKHKQVREQVLMRSRELICNRKDEINVKRQSMLEHIKGALGQMLIERADQAEGVPAGGDYAINLDALDDNRTFTGW